MPEPTDFKEAQRPGLLNRAEIKIKATPSVFHLC